MSTIKDMFGMGMQGTLSPFASAMPFDQMMMAASLTPPAVAPIIETTSPVLETSPSQAVAATSYSETQARPVSIASGFLRGVNRFADSTSQQVRDLLTIPAIVSPTLASAGAPFVMPSNFAFSAEKVGIGPRGGSRGSSTRIQQLGDLNGSLETFLKLVSESKDRDLDLIISALDRLSLQPTEIQDRNLRIAHHLLDWNVSGDMIAAALFLEVPIPFMNRADDISQVLERLKKLNAFTCDYSDKNQVKNLRDLLFKVAESHEDILFIAAQDLVELENASPTNGVLNSTFERDAKRSFFITSKALKYLGLGNAGAKLEDLALLHLDPAKYQEVEERLEKEIGMKREESLTRLREIASDVDIWLKEHEMKTRLKWRVKGLASAKNKRETKGYNYDNNAMRVIIDSKDERDCMKVFFMIKDLLVTPGYPSSWEERMDLFDDYVARPKPNGFKSIHCYFEDPNGYLLEIHIRTEDMDRHAEFGGASHGAYKSGEKFQDAPVDESNIARDMFARKQAGMRQGGVYFALDSETGTIRKLATASPTQIPTVLDFAFAKGINVGLRAHMAIVNFRPARFSDAIQDGQRVFITTSSDVQVKGRLDSARTQYARAILSMLSSQKADLKEITDADLEEIAEHGRVEFKRIVTSASEETKKYKDLFGGIPRFKFSLKRLYKRLGMENEEQFFTALGALPHGDEKTKLTEMIRERVIDNSLMYITNQEGREIRIAYTTEQGALAELLRFIDESGIKVSSFEKSRLGKTALSFVTFRTALATPSQLKALEASIEDLYQIQPSMSAQYAKPFEVRIRASREFDKTKVIVRAMRTALDAGYNIANCTFNEAGDDEEGNYILKLQAQIGKTGKKNVQTLSDRLDEIEGIRKIVINS